MDSISSDTPQDKQEKKCSKCKRMLPLSCFSKNGKRLRYDCKDCFAKWRKEYDARPEVKEYKRIKSAEWEVAHKEERKQYHYQHYWSNPEARRESARRSNEKRPIEERRAYDIQYRQSEHGKQVTKAYEQSEKGRAVRKAISHNRRIAESFRRNKLTAQIYLDQLKRQKYRCYYCGERHTEPDFEWHIEHMVPISRGGTNDPANLVVACKTCNLSKGKKMPHEWHQGGRLL